MQIAFLLKEYVHVQTIEEFQPRSEQDSSDVINKTHRQSQR